jgi:DNA-binding transcriptional ArsR family regulator
MADFDYSDDFLKRVAELFDAFSQPTRLKIIRELHDGPKTVSEIHEAVGGSQPNVSKHLKTLREEGIIAGSKDGTKTRYEIAREEVTMICDYVCGYMKDRLQEEMALSEELADEVND